jgi:hypothetical protein
MNNKLILAGAIGAVLSGIASSALAAGDEWEGSITPYIWLPDVNGHLNYRGVAGGGSGGTEFPNVELGPNDYLSNINFAFAIAGEAHKGDWGVLSDFFYFDGDVGKASVRNLTGPGGAVVVPINRNTSVNLRDIMWELAGTYSVMRDGKSNFDIVAGFRYYSVDTDLEWRFEVPTAGLSASGKVSQNQDIWNGIIGVHGRAGLGDGNWFVPYYLDYGFGNTNSWQGMIGVGYGFGWGDLTLSERYMELSGGSKLVDNLKLNGLQLGGTFHF